MTHPPATTRDDRHRLREIIGVIAVAFVVTLVLIKGFLDGLYGLDWTDYTYHFQQALNVLDGRLPHRDFHTHVGGLSFVLEAFLLSMFGDSYETHRVLGLVVRVLSLTVTYCIFRIARFSVLQAFVFTLVISALFIGFQDFYNFTYLGRFLSLLYLALFMWSFRIDVRRWPSVSLVLGLLIGFLLLIKHNYAVLLFAASFVPIIYWTATRQISLGRFFLLVLCYALGLVAIVLTYLAFLQEPQAARDLFTALTSGTELKGIFESSIKDQVFSAIGIQNANIALAFLVIVVLVIAFVFGRGPLKTSGVKLIVVAALILSPVVYKVFGVLLAGSEKNYVQIAIFLGWHALILVSLAVALIYALCSLVPAGRTRLERLNLATLDPTTFVVLFAGLLFLECIVLADQLSWPGGIYRNAPAAYAASLLALQFLSLLRGADFFAKTRFTGVLVPVILIVMIVFSPVVERRIEPYRDGGYVALSTPHFVDWQVSANDLRAIRELEMMKETCQAHTLFQLPWSPILYTVLDLKNSTRYDLPYHDTILLDDAALILDDLNDTPPDMLIIEPRYKAYAGAFPARGMKHLYEMIHKEVLPAHYDEMGEVVTAYKTWTVYCRRP